MPTCTCGTELTRLDARFDTCPDCSRCYVAHPTTLDRMADLGSDDRRETARDRERTLMRHDRHRRVVRELNPFTDPGD